MASKLKFDKSIKVFGNECLCVRNLMHTQRQVKLNGPSTFFPIILSTQVFTLISDFLTVTLHLCKYFDEHKSNVVAILELLQVYIQ